MDNNDDLSFQCIVLKSTLVSRQLGMYNKKTNTEHRRIPVLYLYYYVKNAVASTEHYLGARETQGSESCDE